MLQQAAAGTCLTGVCLCTLQPFTAIDLWSCFGADRVTIGFLKDHMDLVFGFPEIVRWSWQTAKELFEKDGIPTEWWEKLLIMLLRPPLHCMRPVTSSGLCCILGRLRCVLALIAFTPSFGPLLFLVLCFHFFF